MKTVAEVLRRLNLNKTYLATDQNNLPYFQECISSIPIDHLPMRQQLRFKSLKDKLHKKLENYISHNLMVADLTDHVLDCVNQHLNNKDLLKQPQADTNMQLLILKKKLMVQAKFCQDYTKDFQKLIKDVDKYENLQEPKIYSLLDKIANFMHKIDLRIASQIQKVSESIKTIVVAKNQDSYKPAGDEGNELVKTNKFRM